MSNGAMVIHGIVEDVRDQELAELRAENAELRADLQAAKDDGRRAKRDIERAVAALRTQLKPLHLALKAVFGEIDAIGGEDAPKAVDSRTSKIWESWKDRLGPTCGKAIDALLLQNDMTQQQLAIAVGISRQHASNIISKLNTTGLINKNGGRISLKSL